MTNGLNPQAENGHTDIANEIVDMFCRYRISGEEWQVLWVVLRKTYGWHKREDHISLSQFSDLTGIPRPAVARALSKLLSKKILSVIKKDNTTPNMYRFNKHYHTWQVVSKKTTGLKGGIKNDTSGVIKNDNGGGIKNDTYKRNKYTKEINTIVLNTTIETPETEENISPGIPVENPEVKTPETLTPIQQVVEHYKKVGGFDKVGGWDRVYFSRYTKSAKQLLGLCNNSIDEAKRAISEVIGYLQGEGLSWTLETVIKQFGHWQTGKLIPNRDKRFLNNLQAGQKFIERGEKE